VKKVLVQMAKQTVYLFQIQVNRVTKTSSFTSNLAQMT
jgi:hypothetical protein